MDGSKYCCPARRWRVRRPLSQGQRRDGSAVCPESPYFRKQFAARRGVRKGREDSLRREDTSKLNLSTLG